MTENNLGDDAELVIKHTPRLESDIDGWLLEVGDEEVVRTFAAQDSAEARAELVELPDGGMSPKMAADLAHSVRKYVDRKRQWAATELSDHRTAEQMGEARRTAECAPSPLIAGFLLTQKRRALFAACLESLRWPPSDEVLDEFRRATPGSEHDDRELPKGTVVFLRHRRGTYGGFQRNWFGPNDHTIIFRNDAGGPYHETIQLKGDPRWRFLQTRTAPATTKH